MRFWDRLKIYLQQFMQGRYGPDQTTRITMWLGIGLYLLGLFLRLPIFTFLAFALYIWTIWRMFSRHRVKRAQENQKFMQLWQGLRTKFGQYRLRFQNRREFKYFHCPNCKTVLRMKRGSGAKTITCPKCMHKFEQKS